MLLQRLKPEIMKCWLILAAWCEKPGAQSFFKAFFEDIVFSKYLSHWSHLQLRPLGFFPDLNTGVLGWVPGTREQRSLLWEFWFMSSALYQIRDQWPFAKDGFCSLKLELIFFFHFLNSFISHLPPSLMVKAGVLMTCIKRRFTFFLEYGCPQRQVSHEPSNVSTAIRLEGWRRSVRIWCARQKWRVIKNP